MAASKRLEEVKNIDQRTKDFIYGYIRGAQELLPQNNIYFCIPTLVIHWILLYFGGLFDAFDVNNCHSDYTISSKKRKITKQKNNHTTAFLCNVVKDDGVHKWKFKIKRMNYLAYTIIIGVWKIKYPTNTEQDIDLAPGKYYGYHVNRGMLTKGDGRRRNNYGVKCKQDDVITMTLDLDKLELRYSGNKRDLGVAFENIEKTAYKVAILIYRAKDTIKIL